MNMPFKLLSATTSPITLEQAITFRDMPASPCERDLLPKRLTELRTRIDAGLATTFHWATCEREDDPEKTVRRMNGFHSSTVLAEKDGAFPDGLMAHIDHYQVADVEGEALLFRQQDSRESARSPLDVAGAYIGLEPDLADVDKPVAKLAVEGIAWFRKEVEGMPPLAGDDRYRLIHDKQYHPFILWSDDLFGIKTPELKRVTILAAMWGTWQANEEAAKQFFAEVARGGIENNDEAPSTQLDRWLEKLKGQPATLKIKAGHVFQATVFCWNAWRRNEKVKSIKYDTAKGFLPIVE